MYIDELYNLLQTEQKTTIFAAIALGTFRALQNLNLFRVKKNQQENQSFTLTEKTFILRLNNH